MSATRSPSRSAMASGSNGSSGPSQFRERAYSGSSGTTVSASTSSPVKSANSVARSRAASESSEPSKGTSKVMSGTSPVGQIKRGCRSVIRIIVDYFRTAPASEPAHTDNSLQETVSEDVGLLVDADAVHRYLVRLRLPGVVGVSYLLYLHGEAGLPGLRADVLEDEDGAGQVLDAAVAGGAGGVLAGLGGAHRR